jgi:hypothetical protein
MYDVKLGFSKISKEPHISSKKNSPVGYIINKNGVF